MIFQYKLMFVFAGIQAVDTIIFLIMAYFYKYTDVNGKKDESKEIAAASGMDMLTLAEATNQ